MKTIAFSLAVALCGIALLPVAVAAPVGGLPPVDPMPADPEFGWFEGKAKQTDPHTRADGSHASHTYFSVFGYTLDACQHQLGIVAQSANVTVTQPCMKVR